MSTEYTRLDKLHEVEREIAMRKRHYPGMVARGQITSTTAQRQIAIMREIADDYRDKAPQEQLFTEHPDDHAAAG